MLTGNELLDWLFQNGVGVNTPQDWCDLIGVQIIDPDGWRGRNHRPFDELISLPEFMGRLSECTIRPLPQPQK